MHPLVRLQRAAALQANLATSYDPQDPSSSSSPPQARSSTVPPSPSPAVCDDIPFHLTPVFSNYLVDTPPPPPDYYLPPSPSTAGGGIQRQQHQPHHHPTHQSGSYAVEPWRTMSSSSDSASDATLNSSTASATPTIHESERDQLQYYYPQQHHRPMPPNVPSSRSSSSSLPSFNGGIGNTNLNSNTNSNALPNNSLAMSIPFVPASPVPMQSASPSSSYHHQHLPSSHPLAQHFESNDNNNNNFASILAATKPPIPQLSLSLSSSSNHSSPVSLLDTFNSPPPSSPIISTGGGGGMSALNSGSRPGSAGIPFSSKSPPPHTHFPHMEGGNYEHRHFQPHPLHVHERHGQAQYPPEANPFAAIADFSAQATTFPPLDNLLDSVNQVHTLDDVIRHPDCLPPSMLSLNDVGVGSVGVVGAGPHHGMVNTSLGDQVGGMTSTAETIGVQVGVGMEGVPMASSTVADMEMLAAFLKLMDSPAGPVSTSNETGTGIEMQVQAQAQAQTIMGEMNHHGPVTAVQEHHHPHHLADELQRNPNTTKTNLQRIEPEQPITIHNHNHNRNAPLAAEGASSSPSSSSYLDQQHQHPTSKSNLTIPNSTGTGLAQSQTRTQIQGGATITGSGSSSVVALDTTGTVIHDGSAGVVLPRTRGPALITLGAIPQSSQQMLTPQDARKQLQARAYASSQQQQQQQQEEERMQFFQMQNHRQQYQQHPHPHQEMMPHPSSPMTVSPVATVSPTQFQFQVPSTHPPYPHPHQQQRPPAPPRVQSTSAIGNNASGPGGAMGRRRGWSTSSSLSAGTKRKRGTGGGGPSLSVSVPVSPMSSRRPASADSAEDDDEGEEDVDDDDDDDDDYEEGRDSKKSSPSTSVGSGKGSIGSATLGVTGGAQKRKPRKRANTLASAPCATTSTSRATPRPASAGNGATTATTSVGKALNKMRKTTPTPAPTLMTTASGRPIRTRRSSTGRQSASPSSTSMGPGGWGANGGPSTTTTTMMMTTGNGKVGPAPRKRRCELCRKLKTKCTYAPEMQKCTTCAERGDDVLCVLVQHESTIRAKAKAQAQAQAQQQQQQSSSVLVTSPTQMDMDLGAEDASAQQPPSSTSVPAAVASESAADSSVPEGYAPPSIIIQRIVSPKEVKALFRIFFDRMNPYAMILDETVHTVPHVLVRYPLVFATVCAMASRFLTTRPDLYAITTSLALESLVPHLAASNTVITTTTTTTPSADASIALAILALWTAPRRTVPPPSRTGPEDDVEMAEKEDEPSQPSATTATIEEPSSGPVGDDRHAWSACALRMAEAMHAAAMGITAKSSAAEEQEGDLLASPIRVLAICHAVDRGVRLNFSFPPSPPLVPSLSSFETAAKETSNADDVQQPQQHKEIDLESQADRAARAMAQLLRLMNPNGTGITDQSANIQACAFELDNILHALVAAQREHLCATPAKPPPLAYTSVAVQASFYRLVAYALQSASLGFDESESMMEQESSRFDALLAQAIDHACGTLQMVYQTTGASEGLFRFAPEPMLAKVVSIGLCLVHTLRLVPPTAGMEDSPASRINSQLHHLIDHLRSIAVDDNHSAALYSRILSETLRASMNASPNHILSREQRKHMLLQLPYFLLQKALWPLGTNGRSIRST